MKTIILHLGTHKAASTSVQLFLAHNREALRDIGICYPLAPEPTAFAHHGLAWTIIQQYTALERRPANYSLEDALREFRASECETLLLSSEDFLTCSFYDGFLDTFMSTLRQDFDRAVVTAYVRNRKDFFTSSYNQWIKSLTYSCDFDTYISRVLKGKQAPMHYTRALDMWGEVADEAIYLPFLPATYARPVERQLLAALGIDDHQLETLRSFSSNALNASIGPLAIVAYRRLAAQLEHERWFEPYDLGTREKLTDFLEHRTQELGWNEERFRVFHAQHLAAVHKVFHGEDQAFSRCHLKAPWSEVFPDEFEADAVTERHYRELSRQERRAVNEFVACGMDKAGAVYGRPDGQSVTNSGLDRARQLAGKGLGFFTSRKG